MPTATTYAVGSDRDSILRLVAPPGTEPLPRSIASKGSGAVVSTGAVAGLGGDPSWRMFAVGDGTGSGAAAAAGRTGSLSAVFCWRSRTSHPSPEPDDQGGRQPDQSPPEGSGLHPSGCLKIRRRDLASLATLLCHSIGGSPVFIGHAVDTRSGSCLLRRIVKGRAALHRKASTRLPISRSPLYLIQSTKTKMVAFKPDNPGMQ